MFSAFGLETVRLGLKNLRLHKLRSFLTALGIIFGVAAVICMLSISEGASASEMELIELLGTHNIIVKSIKPDRGTEISQETNRLLSYGVTRKDVERIGITIPHIREIVPMREVCFEVTSGAKRFAAAVVGAPAEFFRTVNVPLASGRAIQANDLATRAKVCVIGDEVKKQMFPLEDPIGRTITAANLGSGAIPYEIIGVMARVLTAGRPARGIGERDLNTDVLIPLTTTDARYGDMIVSITSGSEELRKVEYSDLYLRVDELDNVIPVSEMVTRVLEHSHDAEKDYEVQVPLARLRLAEQERANRQITLGTIAGVSLLVGGIGIMNIMLASVTERTREIGVRRALGAKQRHVVSQFLIETVVLSTAGGLLGIALGCAGAWVITELAGWDTIVRAWTIAVSFGLSVMVGVFFGMYPAIAAAKLDPIEALRHE